MRRLKHSEIPVVKAALLKKQGYVCPLCSTGLVLKDACLDHNHNTGEVRGVLCRNCNGIEGKIYNLANRAKRHSTQKDFLGRLILYWIKYESGGAGLLHPLHKTDDEKREARNAKARKTRAIKKAVSR